MIDDEEEFMMIFNKTIELINSEKYYLNKNLKLSDLARELSFNERMVSRAINKFAGQNHRFVRPWNEPSGHQ